MRLRQAQVALHTLTIETLNLPLEKLLLKKRSQRGELAAHFNEVVLIIKHLAHSLILWHVIKSLLALSAPDDLPRLILTRLSFLQVIDLKRHADINLHYSEIGQHIIRLFVLIS